MKKAVRRTLGVIMAAAMAMGLMTGCPSGKGEQEPAGEVSGPQGQAADPGKQVGAAGEQTTIKFWDGNWQEIVWPEVEAIWNQEYPDIKIEAEFQTDLANDKYMLALISDTAPDVMACAPDWVTTFGSASSLEPLDEYMAKDSFDISQFVQRANDVSIVDGKSYGLLLHSETYVMYYNKDTLSAAGYDTPSTTWEEVKEVAAACINGDVHGYGLCGTNHSNLLLQYITMLCSSGSDTLSADNSAPELGNSVAVETTQLCKDLAAYSPVSLSKNDNIANRTLFASGKIAMYSSGIYDLEEIVKTDPDLGFACATVSTANGAKRNTILGGWSMMVVECSKEKEAAWEFVKLLTGPDAAAIYTNTLTGTAEAVVHYADYPEDIIKPNAEALQYASALPAVKNIAGIRRAIMDNPQLMLSEDTSVEEAGKLFDQAVNGLLE